MTHCKPRSEPRSERAHERKDPLTWWVLGYNLAFSSYRASPLREAGLLKVQAHCPR